MHPRRDDSTHELASVRLVLHAELIFVPQRRRAETAYRVELPSRSKFFRIGRAEYVFISLLDGQTTVAEALALTARQLGPDAFTEPEAIAICQWLLQAGLARPAEGAAASMVAAPPPANPARRREGIHPFWIKVPLFCPDDWLDRLRPYLSRLYSGFAFAVWLLVCLAAAGVLYVDWQRFSAGSVGILAPSNWWSLAAAWLVLKLGHEASHAAVCKKHGGTVREVGVIFVLFAPVAYVDVTSCWRFSSKWQRIHTAAAGVYGELFLAALAVIGWSRTDSAVMQQLLYNVAFMASLTTILFNANPLMRFDGYYIVADLTDVPNLYSQGMQWVRGVAARLFFGNARPVRLENGWRGAFVRVYGSAATIWRVMVSVSLTIAASTLFQGWGIVLAAAAVALWLARPIHHIASELHRRQQAQPLAPLRFVSLSLILAGLLVAGLQLPWPGARTAAGIVDFQDLAVIRPGSPGFVDEIHCTDGMRVAAGQPLLTLRNEQLQNDCRDLELACAVSERKQLISMQKKEIAAAQIELENRRALDKRLAEKRRQLDALVVRAPRAGVVMVRNLPARLGTYLREGEEVLYLGEPGGKELRASVSEADAPHFAARVRERIAIRLQARGWSYAHLVRMTPQASLEPLHPALRADMGGPLPVRLRKPDDKGRQEYELTEPRFRATLALSESLGSAVSAGEIGQASIRLLDTTIGARLYWLATRWVRHRLDRYRSPDL